MSTTQIDPLELLGAARPDRSTLTELVRAVTGDPGAVPVDARAEAVDYAVGTPSTEALVRVRGTARHTDGTTTDWSVFVKRVRSVRYWEHLQSIPEPVRETFVANVPWRLEIAIHESGVAGLLPDGMRLPVAYRIDESDDERATVWMEDVVECAEPWDVDRFTRAAYLLGRLAARRQTHLVEPVLARPDVTTPGVGLRFYVTGQVSMRALPALADDATWQHPLLSAAVCRNGDRVLRTDLLALGRRVPQVLDALDRLPQTYQHGDASPQNLLVPAGDPGTFVVIDWGFDCPQAVGFDLGQLLIGLGHAGLLEAEGLRAVHDVIVDAFTEGLNADGHVAGVAQVRLGYLGSLMLRSAFTALPLELLDAPPIEELAALFDQRVRLTRFMVDLMRELDMTAAG
jgi:Phosphotransferase enzyme family